MTGSRGKREALQRESQSRIKYFLTVTLDKLLAFFGSLHYLASTMRMGSLPAACEIR